MAKLNAINSARSRAVRRDRRLCSADCIQSRDSAARKRIRIQEMKRFPMIQDDLIQLQVFRRRVSPSLISLNEEGVIKRVETMNSTHRGLGMPGFNRETTKARKQIKVGCVETWKVGNKTKRCPEAFPGRIVDNTAEY